MSEQPTSSDTRAPDPVRTAALEALLLVAEGQPTDDAVAAVSRGKHFRPVDTRFLMQLVNGTTKMRRRLDHEIRFYLARPATELAPRLTNILRLGFYQIVFLDRVPAAAAVSEAVNLARFHLDAKLAGLVNAVLRTRLREPHKVRFIDPEDNPVKHLADRLSYPEYFVQYCLDEFGFQKTENLLQQYNLPPHVTYRVNFLKAKPDEVTHLLQENQVDFSFGHYLPEFLHIRKSGLPLEDQLISSGKVFVQDESSGLPVRLLNPKPGDNVADLTAAPGGKATYAAIRMRNRGRVTAVDKSHTRLQLVVENAQRMGIKIVAPVAADLAEFNAEPFDRVLLDPPCSGWGTARKHADLRWAKSTGDIENLTKIQAKMIDRASRLVKPGGVLVYSTCTIIRAENDQVVEEFLIRNQEFSIESGSQFFGPELVSERGFLKTYPELPDLEGSFCARLRRRPY